MQVRAARERFLDERLQQRIVLGRGDRLASRFDGQQAERAEAGDHEERVTEH